MTKKKNRFWTFCFSLIPGAGEMYMGFMKMGISLMSLFILVLFLAISLNMGTLILIDVVVWFYSFFHVHNLRAMDDEDFYVLEDHFLFQNSEINLDLKLFSESFLKRYQKIIGIALVAWGISIIWKNIWSEIAHLFWDEIEMVIHGISYRMPQMVLAGLVVWAGVLMICGKKKELYEDAKPLCDGNDKGDGVESAEDETKEG